MKSFSNAESVVCSLSSLLSVSFSRAASSLHSCQEPFIAYVKGNPAFLLFLSLSAPLLMSIFDYINRLFAETIFVAAGFSK
jgi:hypothetical protein